MTKQLSYRHSHESGNPVPPLCHSDEGSSRGQTDRNLNSLNVSELLTNPLFIQIQSYGLIDEIALRNLIIKNEYRNLRSKLHLGDAVYALSQKYFLSEYAINKILFRKRNKKPISFQAIKF